MTFNASWPQTAESDELQNLLIPRFQEVCTAQIEEAKATRASYKLHVLIIILARGGRTLYPEILPDNGAPGVITVACVLS